MFYEYYYLNGRFICHSAEDLIDTNLEFKTFTGYVYVPYWDAHQTQFFKNGMLHREDGPACITPGLNGEYWVNGFRVNSKTPEQFKLFIDLMKLKRLL